MSTCKPPNPDFKSPRQTSGGSGMNPPSARATTRSTPGRKGMAPVAAVGKVRSTTGGKNLTPPAPDVPPNQFVDPIATRPTPEYTTPKAG